MATSSRHTEGTDPATRTGPGVPRLRNGDRLTRAEFERRYAAMPQLKKAELIDGIVYMPSPVSDMHSHPHAALVTCLGLYESATPGVRVGGNGTVRLDARNEPQPDVCLRIASQHGGQSRISDDDYVEGAPEPVAEVAVSSASYDLHDKLRAYERNGVQEYIVFRVEDEAVDWFIWRQGQYERLALSPAGQYRSQVFPGLWLDAAALIRGDLAAVVRVAQAGIASSEHTAFVARLEQNAVAAVKTPRTQIRKRRSNGHRRRRTDG